MLAAGATGARIVVQRDGGPTATVADQLTARGASVVDVPVYRWTMPQDIAPAIGHPSQHAAQSRIAEDLALAQGAAGGEVGLLRVRVAGESRLTISPEPGDDLERLASSREEHERRAAALALAASPDSRAAAVLKRLPDEARQVKSGSLSWDSLNA